MNPFRQVRLAMERGAVELSADGETIRCSGNAYAFDADAPLEAVLRIESREFQVLSLDVHAPRGAEVRRVFWFPGAWDDDATRVICSTALQQPFLFVRKGAVSFFLSLDFPYSRITEQGIWYPPAVRLRKGASLDVHSLTIGACRLTGRRAGAFDVAEIEAASAYVERRHPPRFERPMFVSTCITNRMTDVREGRVFYSMHDNPTIALDPGGIEEDLAIMSRIGVEYFQLFEGAFDWPKGAQTASNMRRIMRTADRLGVKVGDYVTLAEVHCDHYNYEHRRIARPAWRIVAADGSPRRFCLGAPEFVKFLRERLVRHNRRWREKMICLDFLAIEPCYATNHGHPPGDVYRQVCGLVEVMDALAAVSPDYLIWSNAGNWIDFMPKLVWHNPNVYLTDPHLRAYASTLSQFKLLGDGRREQMVTVHEQFFVPYRAFCNCEYYAFPRGRVPDLQVFEYSFLQGLAVTPNICPAETRVFLNRIPSRACAHCEAFMRKWMGFVRANFALWKSTLRVGAAPGAGAAEVYAHPAPRGDRAFVCLVNQNPFPCTGAFRLDETLGLRRGSRFAVREIYPRECAIEEQSLPFAPRGETLTCLLAPHTVRFLSVRPWRRRGGIEVSGHPASVRRTGHGYVLHLRAAQGRTLRLGIALPGGQQVTSVTARHVAAVPMYRFNAAARVIARKGNLCRIEVTMPRREAPRAITRWRVTPGGQVVDLPMQRACGFMGALVHGAFSEDLDVEVSLTTRKSTAAETFLPTARSAEPARKQTLRAHARQSFTAAFELPFIEGWGCDVPCGEDAVIELVLADPGRVKSIVARLNGAPVQVMTYRYPRDASQRTYYLELAGNAVPGTQNLEVTIQWKSAQEQP